MTKAELIKKLRDEGYGNLINSRMTKDEVQAVYDKLLVPEKKKEPGPEEVETLKPEETETPKPEETETPEPEETETPKPEEETPEPKEKEVTEPEEKEVAEPEPAAEPEPEVKKPEDKFSDLLGQIEGAEAPPPKADKDKPLIEKRTRRRKKKESSPDSFMINGYILMLVTDTAFPAAFSFVNNLLDSRRKVKTEDLQLDQKQWDNLEPVADQAAEYMQINLNPIAGFLFMSTFMYGNNLLVVRMNTAPLPKKETKK